MTRAALLAGVLFVGGRLAAAGTDIEILLRDAQAAEARLDSAAAAELYLAADRLRPNDAVILQKIAKQYSDQVFGEKDRGRKKQLAETALAYARRSVDLAPDNAVHVLSLAICHGHLALVGDTSDKVRYSRLIKQDAERALQLDPNYAWAHHLLGRWHLEVARLGMTARFLVKLIYGGLPPASKAEGLRHLRRATELEPAEPSHWVELGHALAANGDPAAARTAWQKALDLPARGKHDEPAQQRARAALEASR